MRIYSASTHIFELVVLGTGGVGILESACDRVCPKSWESSSEVTNEPMASQYLFCTCQNAENSILRL